MYELELKHFAVIHTALLSDEKEVLTAFCDGRKMVIIKREPPATYEETRMYQRLEEKGVITIPKKGNIVEEVVEKMDFILKDSR